MRPKNEAKTNRGESLILGVILVLALIHGAIYVFLVPPWQHYDEPTHFEYVWLTANMTKLPQPGDYEPGLSRQVLTSMIAQNFYKGMPSQPDIPSEQDQEVRIPGLSQLGEPPLYYLLASLPLRWMGTTRIEVQLYAARAMSLLLFLFTIFIAWGIAREVFAPDNPLRWMFPLMLALLPGFTDLMTSVNNDVAAVSVTCLFIWGSVRLVKKGLSWLALTVTLAAMVLSYLTKNTAMVIIPLFPVVLFFAALQGAERKYAWALVILSIAFILSASLSWGEAAYWYRSNAQKMPTRVSHAQAVVGEYAIGVETQAEITPRWNFPLFQPIPTRVGKANAGDTVTLGVWMWADKPTRVAMPILCTPSMSISQDVELSETPQFFAYQAALTADSIRTWVAMPRMIHQTANRIYYDGLVLAEGPRPLDAPPVFSSPDGSRGEWGGRLFINMLRNGSGEQAGLGFRSWIDDLGARILPDNARPSLILTSLLDWSATGAIYQLTAEHMVRTFWGKFGWGHVPLLGNYPYRYLLAATLLGLFGVAIGFVRRGRHLPWDILLVMGLLMVVSWGIALVRGAVYLGYSHMYIPPARHAAAAIIPTVLVLCAGWLEVYRWLGDTWRRLVKRWSIPAVLQRAPAVLYILMWLSLDALSVASIAAFYD